MVAAAAWCAGCSLLLESGDATFLDAAVPENVFAFAQEEAYVKAINPDRGDQFGGARLALDGDRLAVGSAKEASAAGGDAPDPADNTAPGAGAVYLFVRGDDGWVGDGYVKPDAPRINDGFEVVALSGDTLAVGAPARVGDAAGRVYVFERGDEGWGQRGEALVAPERSPGDEFGAALALSGDTLAIGAPGGEAVHVFMRGETADWTFEQTLSVGGGGLASRFGAALSISGERLAIGAPQESSATAVSPCSDFEWRGGGGAVYVFERDGTRWMNQRRITPVDIDLGASFGATLALSGETLAIGAPFEEPTAVAPGKTPDMFCSSGIVHVLTLEDGEWVERAELQALNAGLADRFGTSVALEGDRLVVGAPFEDSAIGGPFEDGLVESGAVYGFERDDDVWRASGMLKAHNAEVLDLFGAAVALSDSHVAVGALDEDGASMGIGGDAEDNTAPGAGAVYTFSWDR